MGIIILTLHIKTRPQLQLGPRPKVPKITAKKNPFWNGRFKLLTKNLQTKLK